MSELDQYYPPDELPQSPDRLNGIVEGLRMAAEMLKNRKRREWGHQVTIDGFEFYQEVIAKAKEVEEAKGGK